MNVDDTTINDLLQTNTLGVKLSIFQPTHLANNGPSIQEDTTRFKNALQAIKAHEAYDESVVGNTMQSLEALLDDAQFWQNRTAAMAVFADAEGYEVIPLATEVTEAYYVQDTYQVGPLLLEANLGSTYYILDINHTRPRLLEADASTATELLLKGMPGSFEEMTENVEYVSNLQHQSGGNSAYHGHSDEAAIRDDTLRYYRTICSAIEDFLMDHTEPLVLVGVQNRVGAIRQLITYPHALDEYVEGSGEAMNEQQMHDATLPIVQQLMGQKRDQLIEKFVTSDPTIALVGSEEIMRASEEGRIDTLIVPAFRQTADTVREGYEPALVLHSETETSEDLVRKVLGQGGKVTAVDMESFEDERPRALCRF